MYIECMCGEGVSVCVRVVRELVCVCVCVCMCGEGVSVCACVVRELVCVCVCMRVYV